jgi:hypothetical protein
VSNSENPNIEPLSRIQVLVIMGVTAVLLLIAAKLWQRLGSVVLMPIRFNPFEIFLGFGIAGGIIIASGILYRVWEDYRRSADFYLQLILQPLVWTDMIWLGLLPGLSEELLFRGVMLPALGFNLVAVVISSLLFGVLHLSGSQQWAYVIWATVVGFVFGLSALYTGNLLVPIVAHITTNCVSGFLWKLEHRQTQ